MWNDHILCLPSNWLILPSTDIWRLSNSFWTQGLIQTSRTGWKYENHEILHSRHYLHLYSPSKTRGMKDFDRSNKCCLQEGGVLPRPRSPLWKNRHRSHSSRLTSRDGENNDFGPTKPRKFYHLVFLAFLSDFCTSPGYWLSILPRWGSTRRTGRWSTRTRPCTWPVGTGTPGPTSFLYLIMKFFVSKYKIPTPQGGWGAAASRTRYQRTDCSRNRSAWGCALWQGVR